MSGHAHQKKKQGTLTIKRTGPTHSKVQFFGFVTFSPVYIRCRFKTNGFQTLSPIDRTTDHENGRLRTRVRFDKFFLS